MMFVHMRLRTRTIGLHIPQIILLNVAEMWSSNRLVSCWCFYELLHFSQEGTPRRSTQARKGKGKGERKGCEGNHAVLW